MVAVCFLSNRCCFPERLTLRLTLACFFFLPYAFPQSRFSSWCKLSTGDFINPALWAPGSLLLCSICSWPLACLLWPGENNCRPICPDRLIIGLTRGLTADTTEPPSPFRTGADQKISLIGPPLWSCLQSCCGKEGSKQQQTGEAQSQPRAGH